MVYKPHLFLYDFLHFYPSFVKFSPYHALYGKLYCNTKDANFMSNSGVEKYYFK